MVPKIWFIVLFTLFIFPILCYGTKPKPFEFLQTLQGCHRGENSTGLHELKQYLKNFGYFNYPMLKNSTHAADDEFDEFLESAIKHYQLNYHLNVTGTLDSETVTTMMKPRCGMPDVINGTTSMGPEKKKGHHHKHRGIHTTSHYAFFSGNPHWPASRTHLTYAFLNGENVETLSPICARAFAKWSAVTHFTFQEITDYTIADITIGVYRGDHGDGHSFDGLGGVLAHAYSPPDGRFHYDGDENWADGALPGYFDLETVSLHEIGHLLGLHHSSVKDAIMFPTILPGVKMELHADDIEGIQVLYGL